MATAAVTTAQSAWLTLTGVGTEMHPSTQALEDDEGATGHPRAPYVHRG